MTRLLPKGHRSCLDPAFHYIPSGHTDVASTFARIRRQQREADEEATAVAEELARVVKPLAWARQ